VESSVDAPVVDGSEVGVAVDDDPVEDGVSEVEYGVVVEPIEASAVIGESSVTRHTSKSSVSVAKTPTTRYVLLPFLDWLEYQVFADTSSQGMVILAMFPVVKTATNPV